MTSAAALPSTDAPLPRGRHGLPPEVIAANQRERLMAAAAEAILDRGYAGLVVGDIIDRARVSRATFYKLFEDKLDCVRAGQRWSRERVEAAVVGAFDRAGGRASLLEALAAAVSAALDFAVDHPGQARLVLASGYSPLEPDLTGDRALHARIADALRSAASGGTSPPADRRLEYQAAAAAALALVAGHMAREAGNSMLPALRDDICRILLVPTHHGSRGTNWSVLA